MQLLSICALAAWKGMHWVCYLVCAPPFLRAGRSYCKTSTVYTAEFVLWYEIFQQILIQPAPSAHLFRLGLGLNNPQNAERARSVFSSSQSVLPPPHDEWGNSGMRCDFSKAVDLFKGLARAAWTIQVCNPTRRKFHSSLGWNVSSCAVCPFTLRQRLPQMPEFQSKRIQVKAPLLQLQLVQHCTY